MLRLPLLIALTLALFCGAPGCSGTPSSSDRVSPVELERALREIDLEVAELSGSASNSSGVGAGGNPYQGIDLELSVAWLKGWSNSELGVLTVVPELPEYIPTPPTGQ